MSWINGIRGLVSSDELAKDVTGAEALLERHQVHRLPAEQQKFGCSAGPGRPHCPSLPPSPFVMSWWLTLEWASSAGYLIPFLLLAGTPDRN